MNVLSLTQRRISAKMFAGITMVSLLLSAFPAAFFVAEAAVAPTSGITMEVVVNPVGSDPDLEYIKITNDGPDTLSLVDFKLDEGGTELPFIGGTVLSGDSFLICANGTFADNGGKSCYATFPTGFDLVNTGGTVTLYGESNTELISVTWGDVSGTESDSATASDSFTPAPVACTPQIEDGLPTGPVQNTDTTQFFTTIQNAIDDCDTDAGDTIVVQSGSHVEAPQVVVGKNITLLGQGINDTTINSDADTGTTGDARSWFFVETGVEFNVKDLTFDGVGHKISEGIRHGGAGTIDTVRFKDIGYFNNGTDGKPYRGTALRAHGDGPVHVKNSEFENIGRIGVLFRGSGVAGSTFTDNTYTGKGDGDWLDYALDISAGAEVTVTGNTISNNTGEATVDGSTSAGILVSTYFGAGTEAVIENNNLLDNTLGIAVGYTAADTSDVQVAQNNITGNTEYGILALENTRVTATENWWGDATGPDGEGLGTGDKVSEHVGFEPWLCGPFADSPDSSEGGVCKAPEPDTTLRVCKIIRDTNGAIIDGSTVAGTDFSVDIAGPNDYTNTVTFSTALTLDTNLVTDNQEANDAACVVLENLDAGMYTYSAEEITNDTGAVWATPLYHDYFNETPTTVDGFYGLTVDGQPGDNDNADGVINISKGKQRTLAMVNTIESIPSVTVSATKIVCEDETELPNWGKKDVGPATIASTTASQWLTDNLTENPDTTCRAVPDWKFQWSDNSVSTPSQYNSYVGEADGWNTFMGTTEVPMGALNGGNLEFREVLTDDTMAFAGGTGNDVSPEFYCVTDGLNYDNLERINHPKEGETYHCVAWNVVEPQTSEVTMCKFDDEKNALPGWQLALIGAEVDTLAFAPTAATQSMTAVPAGDYVLKAEGTYNYGNGNRNADARFSERKPGEANYGGTFSPWALSTSVQQGLSVRVAGDSSLWGNVYSPAHAYYGAYNPTNAGNIDFTMYDNQYADNSGAIDITLYEGFTGVTNSDGCVTFTDVPYGDYQIEELMQTGWTNVAGLGAVTVDSDDVTFTAQNTDVVPVEQCTILSDTGTLVDTNETACDPDSDDEARMDIFDGYKYKVDDAGTETPAAGWTITATNGDYSTTTVTDNDGQYEFYLAAGDWTITEEDRNDWSQVKVVQDGETLVDSTGMEFCFFDYNQEDDFYFEITTQSDESESSESDRKGLNCDFYNKMDVEDGGITPDTTPADEDIQRTSSRSSQSGQRFPDRFGFATPAATPQVLGATTANFCPFLEDFMQMGESNDSMEVMKLQIFLNIFKGMFGGTENPVTGTFGTTTDANVKAFQQQFQTEILDPWYNQSIVPHNRPTGFVYKTTLWKINSIVCPDYAGQLSFEGEDLTKNVNTSQDF